MSLAEKNKGWKDFGCSMDWSLQLHGSLFRHLMTDDNMYIVYQVMELTCSRTAHAAVTYVSKHKKYNYII